MHSMREKLKRIVEYITMFSVSARSNLAKANAKADIFFDVFLAFAFAFTG